MTATVFFAVLVAACLHAVWNALVKSCSDKKTTMLAVVIGHVPIALFTLPFAPSLAIEAIPWIIASVALHFGYQVFLIEGYRVGDLTVVYPIARGSAPILVTAISIFALGITFTAAELAGVFLIAVGLLALALGSGRRANENSHAVAMALATGGFIAAYSLVDGIGATRSGSALGYWGWSAVGNALVLLGWMILKSPNTVSALTENRAVVWLGLLGGTASYVAYGLVIWAFTQAPIALVMALRETSIIFALLIGAYVLKERVNLTKVLSVFVAIVGAVLLRLAK